MREIIYTLEQEHRTVLRTIARETKYGSKYVTFCNNNFISLNILNSCIFYCYYRQAPIGDDNYLLLAGRKDLSANHHQKVW